MFIDKTFVCLLVFSLCGVAEAAPPESAPVPAVEAVEEVAELEPVIVWGERRGDEFSVSALKTRGATSGADILEESAQFHAIPDSRGERSVTYRGFDQTQLEVRFEGVELSLPFDGGIDLGKIGTPFLRTVRVLPGALPGLVGGNALGGTVELLPLRAGDLDGVMGDLWSRQPGGGGASLLVGQRGDGGGDWLLGAFVDGAVGVPFSGRTPESMRSGEGRLRRNSDHFMSGGYASAHTILAPGHDVTLMMMQLQGEWGVPEEWFAATPRYWRWSKWAMTAANLEYAARLGERVEGEVALLGVWPTNTLESYDDNTYSSQESPLAWTSRYDDRRLGGRFTGRWRPHDGAVSGWPAMVEWSTAWFHERHLESDGASATGDVERVVGEVGAMLRGRPASWLRWGVSTMTHGEIPSDDGESLWSFSPSGAATFLLPAGFSTRLALSRRVRMPSLKERHSNALGYREANPNLGPETSWNAQGDLRWRFAETGHVQLSLYGAFVEGLVQEIALESGLLQLQNIESATLFGMAGEVQWRPLSWLDLEVEGSGLRARRGESPGHLAYRPGFKVRGSLTTYPTAGLSVGMDAFLVGPQWFQNRGTKEWGELGQSWKLRLRGSYRFDRRGELWIVADNATDNYYQSSFGFPAPGVEVQVGLRFSL